MYLHQTHMDGASGNIYGLTSVFTYLHNITKIAWMMHLMICMHLTSLDAEFETNIADKGYC